MIIGFIIDLAVGLLCIVMGAVIWKKRKVSLIHEYQYKNVKEEDIPGYTRLLGIGLILMGAGLCITGFFNLAGSGLWWIPMLAGFASGIAVMGRAQKKYNGSWLG